MFALELLADGRGSRVVLSSVPEPRSDVLSDPSTVVVPSVVSNLSRSPSG